MNKEYTEAKARFEAGVMKTLQKNKERKETFSTGEVFLLNVCTDLI